ncbi:hypothetical protein D3C87_262160 [compost metagenome]
MFLQILFITIFGGVSFSQDTIVFKNKFEMERQITYNFLMKCEVLNKSIRKKIVKKFKKVDLEDKKYQCQYHFSYDVELDSTGHIIRCDHFDGYSDSTLNKFALDVAEIVKKSNWQIKNKVELTDSCYFMNGFIFTFNTSCNPSKVEFIQNKPIRHKKVVFCYKEENRYIFFNDFK